MGVSTPRQVIEQEILPEFMVVDPARPQFGFWAAEMKVSGEFVGWFSLRPLPENHFHAALGYRLARTFWGADWRRKAYAPSSATDLLSWS